MVWLNDQCFNQSVPVGTYGGSMCTCDKCTKARAEKDADEKLRITVNSLQPGWICPRCGSVYGPMESECYRCNPPAPVATCSLKEAP